MSKVNPENYVTIQGWMITELGLKGNELIIYAVIYGFTQNGEGQMYSGTLGYLCDWTNLSKVSVIKTLNRLVEKRFIEKHEEFRNGIKFCKYCATNLTTGKESLPGSKDSLPGGGKESLPGGKESLLNNTIEEKKETEIIVDRREVTHCTEVIRMYNEICVSYPQVKVLSKEREKAIKARLKTYSMDDIRTVFEKAEESAFLKGGNSRNWSATFDWIMKDANMAKILDGNYDTKPANTSAQKWNDDNENIYNKGLLEWVNS